MEECEHNFLGMKIPEGTKEIKCPKCNKVFEIMDFAEKKSESYIDGFKAGQEKECKMWNLIINDTGIKHTDDLRHVREKARQDFAEEVLKIMEIHRECEPFGNNKLNHDCWTRMHWEIEALKAKEAGK